MKTQSFTPPPLAELGTDLRRLARMQVFLALMTPFACAAGFFLALRGGHWSLALAALYGLGFFTYGSTSHDLVHRNLGLPRRVNEVFLSLTEMLALRSGHAYKVAHLHHHRVFPDFSDIEGRPSYYSFWRVGLEAPIYYYRIWFWAWRAAPEERVWLALEATIHVAAVLLAVLLRGQEPAVAFYVVGVMISGWAYPFLLVYLVHDGRGNSEFTQTAFVRGRVIPFLLFQHTYHLEHHLYPSVPAYKYAELARRLNPYFEKNGLKAIWIG